MIYIYIFIYIWCMILYIRHAPGPTKMTLKMPNHVCQSEAIWKNTPLPGRCGRIFLEALATGQLQRGGLFLASKMHGTFTKHCNLQHVWPQTASSYFLRYNFVAKIVANKMPILGWVQQFLAISHLLEPGWAVAKTGQKMIDFRLEQHEVKNAMFFKTSCFLHVVLPKSIANTSVFGWFALGARSHTVKKTPVFTWLFKLLAEKT